MSIALICIQVFFARILDVTLGTIRISLVSKGKPKLAFIIAFWEMLVWYLVVRTAVSGDFNIYICISFALGFATGTYLGVRIADYLIKGNLGLQIITSKDNQVLIDVIRSNGYKVIVIKAKGKTGNKDILFMEIKKSSFSKVRDIIREYDNQAFVIANETEYVQNGFIK